MHLASQSLRIEIDQVFFKREPLRDYIAFTIEDQAGAIEDETVVAANLVDQNNGDFMLPGDAGQHVTAQFALADPERRGRNVQYEIPAGLDQGVHGIDGIEALHPKLLVVPCVLADRERHAIAAESK